MRIKRKSNVICAAKWVSAMFAIAVALPAQQAAPPSGLTITQAVEGALRNYPSVRVSQEQINAAAAGIQLARTAYLPRIDMLAQANRATRNNVFGLLLPQSAIPSISGPVLGTNNLGTAWGSAVGALVTWEPFDFGFRKASVTAATAAQARQEAALKRTQYEVAVAAADAYRHDDRGAGDGPRGASRRGPCRGSLTNNRRAGERAIAPGADASRAQAEFAAARTQLIQAQQAVELARANLSQFVGMEPASDCGLRSQAASIAAGTGALRQ